MATGLLICIQNTKQGELKHTLPHVQEEGKIRVVILMVRSEPGF